MKNDYLNLSVDDMKITEIINNYKKLLTPNISYDEFKRVLIELDNIRNKYLSEYDEEIISNIYKNLNKKCDKQITHFLCDKTPITEGNFGDLMHFLHFITK